MGYCDRARALKLTSASGTLVYSIGHSSRSAESFLALLGYYGIECLVDVRRYPGSRRHPQFNQGTLETSLKQARIEYLHLGETLGGYRDVDYGEYQESDTFAAGVAALEKRGARSRCAFMCAEKVPWQCHRRFIAEALVKRDWTVRHILDEDTLWDPNELLLGSASGTSDRR